MSSKVKSTPGIGCLRKPSQKDNNKQTLNGQLYHYKPISKEVVPIENHNKCTFGCYKLGNIIRSCYHMVINYNHTTFPAVKQQDLTSYSAVPKQQEHVTRIQHKIIPKMTDIGALVFLTPVVTNFKLVRLEDTCKR